MSAPLQPAESATETSPPVPDDTGRMVILVSVFATLLLVTTWLVSFTWRHFFSVDSLAWTIIPLAFTLSFIPAMLLGFRHHHPLLSTLYKIGAVSLGFLNYAILAAAACWVIFIVSVFAAWPVDLRIVAFFCFGAAALATAYGLMTAACLRVTRIGVKLPHLPEAWAGRRIALVTDVHLGNVRGAGFVRRIVRQLNPLEPSAVLIAGDMFDGASVDLSTIAQPWRELVAPSGVYFVSGNHDEFRDRRGYFTALSAAGIRVLNNEKIELDGLQLVGVHDGEAGEPKLFRQILQNAQIDRERPSILLAHQPANLAIPEAAGISLQLSGHTHGGQFWPWSWLVSRIYGPFAYGLSRLGSLQVYTSSGAGSWGPPLRVGTKAEVVLIELSRA